MSFTWFLLQDTGGVSDDRVVVVCQEFTLTEVQQQRTLLLIQFVPFLISRLFAKNGAIVLNKFYTLFIVFFSCGFQKYTKVPDNIIG